MASKIGSAISRREFARRAALASAAASLTPAELLTKTPAATTTAPSAQTSGAPKLSSESQAEADSRVQAIFSQYGSRLSDAQKADIQRLTAEGQAMLNRLRAFSTDNADGPALYLKPLMEREKKPASKSSTAAAKQPAAPKSS